MQIYMRIYVHTLPALNGVLTIARSNFLKNPTGKLVEMELRDVMYLVPDMQNTHILGEMWTWQLFAMDWVAFSLDVRVYWSPSKKN